MTPAEATLRRNGAPPQNHEAETALLSMMLCCRDAPERLIDELGVQSEYFYNETHQRLWAVAQHLHGERQPVDSVSVATELNARQQLDLIGGTEAIHALVREQFHMGNSDYYAKCLRTSWKARLAFWGCREIMEAASHAAEDTDIAAKAEQILAAIAERGTPQKGVQIRDVLLQVWESIQTRFTTKKAVGEPTGWVDLDELLVGLVPTELCIVAARPACGKAQPLDAMVLTPRGFTLMGDLQQFDEVIGADGKPTTVVGIFPQGELEIYRVTTNDGGVTECCADHLWWTQTRNERRRGSKGSVKTTREIASTIHRPDGGKRNHPERIWESIAREIASTIHRPDGGKHNHSLPVVEPVQFNDTECLLPLDPYALGLLLADGSFSDNIKITNPEADLIDRLAACLPPSDEVRRGDDGLNHMICRRQRNNEVSATKSALISLGLMGSTSLTKVIPLAYRISPVRVRESLLRGLLDGDGYVGKDGTSVEYATSSPQLAADVAFIVRSLAGIVSCTSRIPVFSDQGEKKSGAESFRLRIWFPSGWCPVSSVKHLAKWRWKKAHKYRSITRVEKVGVKQCQCIKVSARDQLYVTDDFIVTHNTAFACCLALNFAQRGIPVFVQSLEMSRLEISERLLCAEGGVDSHDVKRGQWSGTSIEQQTKQHELLEALNRMQNLPITIDDTAGQKFRTIAANARREKRKSNIGLLIVDYLQLVEPDRQRDVREQEVASISKGFKNLAKELEIPVVVLAQLNRAVEARVSKRPMLSDLRESGSVEQDADQVLFLHRPEIYDPVDRPGEADVIVSKNRRGKVGTVTLAWNGATTQFRDMAARQHQQVEAASSLFRKSSPNDRDF